MLKTLKSPELFVLTGGYHGLLVHRLCGIPITGKGFFPMKECKYRFREKVFRNQHCHLTSESLPTSRLSYLYLNYFPPHKNSCLIFEIMLQSLYSQVIPQLCMCLSGCLTVHWCFKNTVNRDLAITLIQEGNSGQVHMTFCCCQALQIKTVILAIPVCGLNLMRR